jgi:hypothetical protein
MPGSERHTLTVDLLVEEFGESAGYVDDGAACAALRERHETLCAILALMPEGFRVERVQGVTSTLVEPGTGDPQTEAYRALTRSPVVKRLDPGCELTLIDTQFRPERVIAKVARRRIGSQKITWTAGQLALPEQAEAVGVLLRYAAADARSRR